MSNPTPTEVIASWIPHDARWHTQARSAASESTEALRQYVSGLVYHYRDGTDELTDEFDRRSIHAVRQDLPSDGLVGVQWRRVQTALLLTN